MFKAPPLRYAKEKCFAVMLRLSLIICASTLIFLLGSIFLKGIGAINLEFIFTPAKDFGKSGGVLYQILGSLLIVLVAGLLVFPVALGTSLFQYSYNKGAGLGYFLEQSLYALNAIPSITYGVFGLIFFVNVLNTGISWFVGSIILAIMMLPTTTLSTYQSFHGVVTGSLIGLARAIGETAPIMFIATAFSGVTVPNSLVEPVSTLPTHILELAQQSTDPQALQNAWGASLILVVLVSCFGLLALFARRRLTKQR